MPPRRFKVPGIQLAGYPDGSKYVGPCIFHSYCDDDGQVVEASPTRVDTRGIVAPITLTFQSVVKCRDVAAILRKMADILDSPDGPKIKKLPRGPNAMVKAVRLENGRVHFFDWMKHYEEEDRIRKQLIDQQYAAQDSDDD